MTGKYDQFVANNFGIQTRNVPSLFLEGRYRAIAIADIPNMNRYQPSQPIPDNNRQDNSLVAGYWMSNFLTIQVHEEQGKFTGRITWAADAKRLKSEFGWNLGQTAFQVILSEETTNYLKYSGVSPQTDNSGKFGINERFSFTVQTLNGRRFLTLRGYGNQLNLYLNN